jgi:hypothetical protein
MTRLFTVIVHAGIAHRPAGDSVVIYECDFAGIHFSRYNESDLIHWVRVAAKRVYGPTTQVLFLHTERSMPCPTPKLTPSSCGKIPSDS